MCRGFIVRRDLFCLGSLVVGIIVFVLSTAVLEVQLLVFIVDDGGMSLNGDAVTRAEEGYR